MKMDTFIEQVGSLRERGVSIRAIASELGVHPSRVQRAVAKLHHPLPDTKPCEVVGRDGKSIFVGREREMVILQQTLLDVISGSGKLVLISGEPGMGKTRLAEEFSPYAKLLHAPVYWGRSHEELPCIPFWPWMQIIRVYINRHRALRLRSDMGREAADIARIVPRVCQKLPDVEPVLPLNDPSEDRFRLFDSINNFFQTSSRRQPMILILDNLQWCDETSLLLLRFLAQELGASRLLIICIYRHVVLEPEHPLSTTLGELSRESCFPQVVLHGLSQNEVAQLIHAKSGIEPSPRFVKALCDRTKGNPLFINNILRSLPEDDSLMGQAGEQSLQKSKEWARASSDGPCNFSTREVEVLKLLARGKTNREIALQLNISFHTTATHVRNILNKGNLANRAEAAAFAAVHYPVAE
jgi:DNA-binding CsgD family transcriptional regulator